MSSVLARMIQIAQHLHVEGRRLVIGMRNQIVIPALMSLPTWELGIQEVLNRLIRVGHRCNGGPSNTAQLTINMKLKPLTLQVEIPPVFHCLDNQVIQVPNVEPGGIVEVDDLEDRENGVEVWRHQMGSRFRFQNVEACFKYSKFTKGSNVDLKEDWADTCSSGRTPAWWCIKR